jgi:predicted esterase
MAFGKLETFEVDSHRVDVWVPEKLVSYTPILMMHDGKNVFDPRTASDNTTWGVLDALRDNKVKADPQPLIVAVHGLGPETRMLELAPKEIVEAHPDIFDNLPVEYKPLHNTSMNGEYNTLLAEKVLPMVLEKYGIEHQLERTAIAGSSMGGLASIYLMSKYPHLFGAALAFSTHWIIGHEYMAQELSKLVPVAGRHKIYTDSGTEGLDLFYQPFHNKAIKGFEARGYVRDRDLSYGVFPGTGHDEGAWASRVHIPINWWLRG